MTNPFEYLSGRMDTIEGLLNKVLHQRSAPVAAPEVGGLELAQEVTRLSKPRIYALVSARALPHSKRGNRLFFNRAELLEWVSAGNRTPNE